MQFNNPTQQKNENKKYDNSTLQKINRPVAVVAMRFCSHPAGARLFCARPKHASTTAGAVTGWQLSRRQHR